MEFETRNYHHAVGEFNYHIQLTVAYRRQIFSSGGVLKLTETYLLEKLNEINGEFVCLEFGPGHIHLFVTNCKNYAPCQVIQLLEGFSSRIMRKNHFEFFKSFCGIKSFGARVILPGVSDVLQRRGGGIILRSRRASIGISHAPDFSQG